MKKKYYSWNDIETMCIQIVNQLYADNWRPDYIVGLTRGGNVPATIISNMTNIPADTLQVNFRDNGLYTESNCWMAEDAYGYGVKPTEGYSDSVTGSIAEKRKKILIVDDINDSIHITHRITRIMYTHKRTICVTLDIECYDDLYLEDLDWKSLLDLEGDENVHVSIKELKPFL